MSRLLCCTALIGLAVPVAVQADGPGCAPRTSCVKEKVCCIKEKLFDLSPLCVRSPLYRPRCHQATSCPQPCGNTSCSTCSTCTTCSKKSDCEIERVVINMQQQPAAARFSVAPQMQTVMVPQQRIVMVPQVQTYFTPQTVVGAQGYSASGYSAHGAYGAYGSEMQTNDATVRAMATLLQQRLAAQGDAGGQGTARSAVGSDTRTLQEIDNDLKSLTERVDALEKAINKR